MVGWLSLKAGRRMNLGVAASHLRPLILLCAQDSTLSHHHHPPFTHFCPHFPHRGSYYEIDDTVDDNSDNGAKIHGVPIQTANDVLLCQNE